jgi:hypothetical protein
VSKARISTYRNQDNNAEGAIKGVYFFEISFKEADQTLYLVFERKGFKDRD